MPNKLLNIFPHFLTKTVSSIFYILDKKNFIYNEVGVDTKILEQSYKTMVIRHPFERILSAYLYFFHKISGKFYDSGSEKSNITIFEAKITL